MFQVLLCCLLVSLVRTHTLVHVKLSEFLPGVVVLDIGLDVLCHLRFFQRIESQLLSLVCLAYLIVIDHIGELSVMPLLFLVDYLTGVDDLPPNHVGSELLLELVEVCTG